MRTALTRALRVLADCLGPSTPDRNAAAAIKAVPPSARRAACMQSALNAIFEPLEQRALMSATFYVSPSGNDNNNGISESSPWKSIGKVNTSSFSAGDNILFEGGNTFYGSLNLGSRDGGSSSAPVTFGSYNGQATINSGESTGATVYNAGNIWFDNLKFAGTPGSTSQAGINFESYAQGVTFSNDRVNDCNISGYYNGGIIIEDCYSNGGFTNLQLTDNAIYNNVEAGINAYSATDTTLTDFYIAYNQVYNNYGDGHTGCTGNGIELGGVSDAMVEYNTAYLNGSKGGEGGVGIWAYDSNEVTFQYNESYDNITTRGNDGDGFDFDSDVSNSVMQYNYAFDNDGTGAQLDQWENNSEFTNNIVRYNVFQDNGRKNNYGNLEVWGKVLNSYLYNNTIYTTPGVQGVDSGIRVHNSTIPGLYVDNVHFVDNIIDTSGGAALINIPEGEAQGAKDLTFTGNIYYSNGSTPVILDGDKKYTSLSEWQDAGQETYDGKEYGAFANPDFVSPNSSGPVSYMSAANLASATAGYKVESGSPAMSQLLSIDAMYGIPTGGSDYYADALASNATTIAGAYQPSGSKTAEAGSPTPITNVSSLSSNDIGSVSAKGSSSYSNGTFSITGAGADIWHNSDDFHYDEMSLTGNRTIIAKVASIGDTNALSKAGVMIRNSLAGNSAEVSMLISPNKEDSFQTRSSTNADTSAAFLYNSPANWVKLVRSGNTFSGYISTNGINWTLVSTSTVSMNSTVLIGLAVTAHASKGTESATFSNVSIT